MKLSEFSTRKCTSRSQEIKSVRTSNGIKDSLFRSGEQLPNVIQNNIFSFLGHRDLQQCHSVNKKFDEDINQTIHLLDLKFNFRRGHYFIEACLHKLNKISTPKLQLTITGVDISTLEQILNALQNTEKIQNIHLNLQRNKFGNAGAQALANRNLPNLIKLNLNDTGLSDAGAEALANGNLPNLTVLHMKFNEIEDAGVQALANGNLPNLTVLNLAYNYIRDAGAQALANGNLPNLIILNLLRNRIKFVGIQALANGKLKAESILSSQYVDNWETLACSANVLNGGKVRFYEKEDFFTPSEAQLLEWSF